MSALPVTSNLRSYEDNKIVDPEDEKNEYLVNLIDTVGLGDGVVTVADVLRQIVEVIPDKLATIHRIIFCIRFDRFRAGMSKDLDMVYNFFKLTGAQPENVSICLTFCDFLKSEVILRFWNEVRGSFKNFLLIQEAQSLTITSFPKLSECDDHKDLQQYLTDKIEESKMRVFINFIKSPCKPFSPHRHMMELSNTDFSTLCDTLAKYQPQTGIWAKLFGGSQRDEIISALVKNRSSRQTFKIKSSTNGKDNNISGVADDSEDSK